MGDASPSVLNVNAWTDHVQGIELLSKSPQLRSRHFFCKIVGESCGRPEWSERLKFVKSMD